MKQLIFLLCSLPVTISGFALAMQTEPSQPKVADTSAHPNDQHLQELLARLGENDFPVRNEASLELKLLSPERFRQLAEQIAEASNAEAVVRVHAELDARLVSRNPEDVRAAWDVLEYLAENGRLLLADEAQHSLRQHWKTRVDLTVAELKKHGAHVVKGDFGRRAVLFGMPLNDDRNDGLQVFLTEDWTGGDTEVALFKRLAMLSGPVRTSRGLNIYLTQGHPLTEEQQAALIEAVGPARVVRRSRVQLGIVWNPQFTPGVLIGSVSEGGSAAGAGLKPGDLIVAIEDTELRRKHAKQQPSDDAQTETQKSPEKDPTLLKDFDDLVQRLMLYQPGDVMTIRVIRGFDDLLLSGNDVDLESVKTEKLDVKMKGWDELKPLAR
ncbi:MAG: PDZ domain-containing protein [Planctomycetaceae bacterium]